MIDNGHVQSVLQVPREMDRPVGVVGNYDKTVRNVAMAKGGQAGRQVHSLSPLKNLCPVCHSVIYQISRVLAHITS